MPKDNIQRAIDKASGGDAENYEELRYEGFGPGGVALIVEALTDNRNRTATNVRTAFSKNGGNLGASGSVSHGFERLGLIAYPASAGERRRGLRGGDRGRRRGRRIGRGRPPDLDRVRRISTESPGPSRPRSASRRASSSPGGRRTAVEVGDDDAGQLLKLIDALEEDDDVQTVWGNYEVSETR